MNTQELDFIGTLGSIAKEICAEANVTKQPHDTLSFKSMIQMALNPIGTVIASTDAR